MITLNAQPAAEPKRKKSSAILTMMKKFKLFEKL